jgi:D-alanyl-D-alanine carboxypeptidase (penicillin-binding protein 5/6)
MSKKRKDKYLIIKIKRASLFCLGMVFFLFPGQNWYLAVNLNYQSPKVQPLGISIPSPADYPINFTGVQPPNLTAQSAVVLDRDSAVVLYGKDEKTKVLPASTVKIMTALVVMDYYNLDDVLEVDEVNGQGQDMELVKGERIAVKNLLYGVLVSSANDAALVLAQNYPGGETGLVAVMNQKAKELNLNDTYFANPTGLDSDQQGNLLTDYSYTTALDLARLTSEALTNEAFIQMVKTPKIIVSDVSGTIKHPLYNLNELLEKLEGIEGVKTGWTQDAGECFIGYAEREGRGIITVILGSQDRFGETTRLVDWVFENFRWQEITPSI